MPSYVYRSKQPRAKRNYIVIILNQKPRILICDSFGTHETLEYCFENNIILCSLPPHTSHKLQPCDVGVFAPLKAAYRDQAEIKGRRLVNFDGPKGYFPKSFTSANMDGSNGSERQQMERSEIDVKEYEEGGPTRIPFATSRAQSPYAQHPPIDSDGLSWPSR